MCLHQFLSMIAWSTFYSLLTSVGHTLLKKNIVMLILHSFNTCKKICYRGIDWLLLLIILLSLSFYCNLFAIVECFYRWLCPGSSLFIHSANRVLRKFRNPNLSLKFAFNSIQCRFQNRQILGGTMVSKFRKYLNTFTRSYSKVLLL